MAKCKVEITYSISEIITVNTSTIDWKEACQKALDKINKKYKNKNITNIIAYNWAYDSFI